MLAKVLAKELGARPRGLLEHKNYLVQRVIIYEEDNMDPRKNYYREKSKTKQEDTLYTQQE